MGFRGNIMEIPIGYDGMIGSEAHPLVTPTKLIQCDNIEYGSGVLRKEGGASKYNAVAITGAPGILGGWDWWPSSGTQRMVVATDAGDILKDSGAGTFPVTLKAGMTSPRNVYIFVEGGKEAAAGNKKLFIFTGTNAVQVLSGDGVVTTNLGTPPADWAGANQPCTGCNHEGRIWGAGNPNDPHRVYYSTSSNHEDFTSATSGSISVFPGEGDGIVCILSFKGLLIVFKSPAGIYAVNTTDPTITNWTVQRLTNGIGCAGPAAAVIIPDDIMFLEVGGEFSLISAVQEFGNVRSKNLSTALELTDYIHETFNKQAIADTHAVFAAGEREVYFFVPATGSLTPNLKAVFDLKRDLPRFRTSFRDTGHTIFIRNVNNVLTPYLGDLAGFVWELDTDNPDKDGMGYEGMFQTPHLDFSHIDPKLATKRKAGLFLELQTVPQGNWNLAVDIIWDGELTQTVQFNMGSTGAALGSFVIGTDALGSSQLLNKKRRITGSGRRLSLKGSNSGAGESFVISKFLVHYKVSDERL